MKIGIRAHDLGRGSAKHLAQIGASLGIHAIQLAPAKALIPVYSYDQIFPEMARGISSTFAAAGIQIAVLGCYINPIHPDPSLRRLEIEKFASALRLAKDFGCSVVATETGSFNLDGSFHPLNRSGEQFTILIESLSEMAGIAESCGVKIGIEPAISHMLWNIDSTQQALRILKSEAVTVIFDPVNILEANTLLYQRRLFDRAIDLFGCRISAIHAKDVIAHGRQSLLRVPLGKGALDYGYLMRQLKNAGLAPPILMEETQGKFLVPAINYLNELVIKLNEQQLE